VISGVYPSLMELGTLENWVVISFTLIQIYFPLVLVSTLIIPNYKETRVLKVYPKSLFIQNKEVTPNIGMKIKLNLHS